MKYTLHLPMLHLPNEGVEPQAAPLPNYTMLAMALAYNIRTHPAQRREVLEWDEDLTRVAKLRCVDMFEREYLNHINPDGIGPNRFLTQNGVQLPDGYDRGATANNVESLRLGPADVDDALDALLASPGHRKHIVGDGWYGGQRRIGVAAGPSWDYLQTIWCVLTLHR